MISSLDLSPNPSISFNFSLLNFNNPAKVLMLFLVKALIVLLDNGRSSILVSLEISVSPVSSISDVTFSEISSAIQAKC